MQDRKSLNNQKISLTVGIVDSANITALFAMFLKDILKRFLEDTGRYFMFPLTAVGASVQAILAWRQARIEKGKNGTVVRAVVETLGALAITTAVVGGFVATSIFAVAAPIIFTATLAAKTLFHAVSSVYYWGKSAGTKDPEKKLAYRAAAKTNAVATASCLLSTVALGFVMLAAKPIVAILGVASGLISTAFFIYKRCKMPSVGTVKPSKPHVTQPLPPKDDAGVPARPATLSQTARLYGTFPSQSDGQPPVTAAGSVAQSQSQSQSLVSPVIDPADVPIIQSGVRKLRSISMP